MATPAEPGCERLADEKGIEATPAEVRDPLANRAALLAARERSMSERLELALSWNAVAAELRDGLAAETDPATRGSDDQE